MQSYISSHRVLAVAFNTTCTVFALILSSLITTGCASMSASQHRSEANSASLPQDLTVGKIQREIHKGMSGAEVAQSLGSPNIVTKDENGLETWVYDRIATEVTYSQGSSGLFIFFYGETNHAGSSTTTQRTLTVVVKFTPQSRIESFSYHASKF